MDFLNWFIKPVKDQYADFEGRTSRQAFWMFVLVSILLQIAISIVDNMLGTMIIGFLFMIAIIVPSIAITARRLHDTNKSGWWQLVGLIPFVGAVILIVLCALKGDETANSYGPVPGQAESSTPETMTATESSSDSMDQSGM